MYKKYLAVKTVLDFIFALLALILTSPIFLIVASAIKIEDGIKAKVFFYQARTGKNGKLFKCYKFRSMKTTTVAFDKHNPVIGKDNSNVTKGKLSHRY